MTQFAFRADSDPPDRTEDFELRSPSTNWERLPLRDSPDRYVWAWFKPPSVPKGLIVTIPEETFHDDPQRNPMTMRAILDAAGVELVSVSACSMYGSTYPVTDPAVSFLDQAILPPAAGADPQIVVWIGVTEPQSPTHPADPAATDPAHSIEVFDRIDADWRMSLQTDQQLAIVRKQIAEILARINSLNRGLTPEENTHADGQDKREWQDARRWMRDATMRLSRYIKEYDVGWTSAAGKRNWFEQMYQQVIVPRQHIEGLEVVARYFAGYRGTLKTLLTQMNNTYAYALNDGERRAQQVLNRIGVKVRAARGKRGRP